MVRGAGVTMLFLSALTRSTDQETSSMRPRILRHVGRLVVATSATLGLVLGGAATTAHATTAGGGSPAPGRPPAPPRVLVGGDWNQPPWSGGSYSPRWVAHRAHLRIHAPARGKHGRIDFLMSDARVPTLTRFRGGGSDHGLVSFHVTGSRPGQSLHGALWNVERDRGPQRQHVLVRYLTRTLRTRHLDFLLLQEAQQYHRLLAGIRGYQLVAKPGPRGARQQVILVRAGIRATQPRFTRMSVRGWRVVTGSRHRPAYTTFVTLDGWIRVASVHETVGVGWRHGHLDGPADRRSSRRGSALRLVAAAHETTRVVAPRLSFSAAG